MAFKETEFQSGFGHSKRSNERRCSRRYPGRRDGKSVSVVVGGGKRELPAEIKGGPAMGVRSLPPEVKA